MNERIQKVSLQERLRRLEIGNSSSPQFSRKLIDTFCQLPVFPTFKELEEERLSRVLHSLLKMPIVQRYYRVFKNPKDPVTFGDLAVLTAVLEKYDRTPMDEKKRTDIILVLTCVFFSYFDLLKYNAEQKRDFRRGDVFPGALPLYDFLNIPFNDYYEYTAQCGPSKYAEKMKKHLTEKELSTGRNPFNIYLKLRAAIAMLDIDWFWDMIRPADEARITIADCEPLLDFFICPLAIIALANANLNDTQLNKGGPENEQ